MKIFDALVATVLLVSPAVALDGELVTKDAFPFVVKIRAAYTKPTGSFMICTATVLEPRLVLTAAHCISKPYPGADGPDSFVANISKDITIYYADTGGKERTAKSKSTFYDRAFLSNFFKFWRIMPQQLNGEAREKLAKSLPPSKYEMVTKLSVTYRMADVAYIVPDHRIELKTYPRFIFDDFKPEKYLDGSGEWLTFSSDKVPGTGSGIRNFRIQRTRKHAVAARHDGMLPRVGNGRMALPGSNKRMSRKATLMPSFHDHNT
jgi:Trypsin